MGLLDDAIREHLELRRRHGADPSEVMSKEHEALGPATARAGGVRLAENDVLFAAEPSMTAEDRREGRRRGRPEADRGSDDPHLSEETVELDMRAVMDEDASIEADHGARGGVRSVTNAAPVRALR